MTASISFQSVKDRRAFLRETLAPERSEENNQGHRRFKRRWFAWLEKDGG